MNRPLVVLAPCRCLVGCGGGGGRAPAVRGPVAATLPPANPAAAGKMIQGAQAARDPRTTARAIELFREAIAIDPTLWEARYDLGVVLAQGGALADAERELVAAAKIAPAEEDVAIALAETRRRRGSHKEAAAGLEAFVRAQPRVGPARTLLVTTLRDAGQVDRAIVEAREVLAKRPGDATALSELSLCHLAKGERDTAHLLARQAVDANPGSAVAHRASGLVSLAEGEDARAFQAFQKAATLDARDTTARLNMGAVLLRAGSYARAEEQYRAILAVAPDDAAAEVGLAVALRGQADPRNPARYDHAKAVLERVIERDPHNTSALFNLGVLMMDHLKRADDAERAFARFLAEAPADHPARADAERWAVELAARRGAPGASGKPGGAK